MLKVEVIYAVDQFYYWKKHVVIRPNDHRSSLFFSHAF
jgi:hypothetical protein